MARVLGTTARALLLLLVVVLAGCGEDDTVSSGPGDGSLPPTSEVEQQAGSMAVHPAAAPAGSLVELTFDADAADGALRGAGWTLEPMGPEDPDAPYLLVATSESYTCTGCPRWYPAGEGGVEDIGISGPGPDVVRIPDLATPGAWRICNEGSGEPTFCADLAIVGRQPTNAGDATEQSAMTITPRAVVPGQLAELGFPSGRMRGPAWLLRPTGETSTGEDQQEWALWASHAEGQPPTSRPMSEVGGVPDVGYDGPGPDLVRIPEGVAAGSWEVCDIFPDDPDAECVAVEVLPV